MKMLSLRSALLAAGALVLPVTAYAGPETTPPAAADTDQTTSANQAGQANDKQSLTSSDIIVTGSRTAEAAPLTVSLATTQPQSAVSRDYIEHAVASADFNTLIALTPGVSLSGAGNGFGFSETKVTIRGFQDGEYNVTYDSIPFADTNNPTHHSTAFFPSNTIETVVVDRGPGNASQLGQATYGGNVNLYSRAASDTRSVSAEALLGNWNSFMARAEIQSGTLEKLGGARFVLTGQYLESDGALTYSPVGSKNLYGKAVVPIGTANTLTVMSTWNRNFYYQSDVLKGATCGSATKGVKGFANAALGTDGQALTQLTGDNCAATSQIAVYGTNYGMGNDPTQQDYWRYNRTDKTTDFSYLRLQTQLAAGVSMDNRAYMYGYTNNTMSGNTGNVVTGFTGAGTSASPYKAVNGPSTDILGYNKLNKYRVLGYIGQVDYDFGLGKLRVGGWYEHAVTDRHNFDLDRTTGLPSFNEKFNNGSGTTAANALPSIAQANINFVQHSTWDQYQLFSELEIRPVDGVTITPGVKYVHFTRGVNAALNQKTRAPLDTSATWTKALPFLTANWRVTPSWSFYGQYAQGMYVPDLSSFYSASGTLSTALDALKPQTTTNYQVGTVWHGATVSIDADAYIIDVKNKIGTCTTVGCDTTLLVNVGQVRYKGVEGGASVMPLHGLTLFANGSYNYAHSTTTDTQIAKAPFSTAAAGFVYRKGGFRLSFDQKVTGPQYASDFSGAPGPRLYRIRPYGIGTASVSQDIGEHLRLGATVSNVFNSRAITSIATSASGGPTTTVAGTSYQTGYGQGDQFSFLPPRAFMVDMRVKF